MIVGFRQKCENYHKNRAWRFVFPGVALITVTTAARNNSGGERRLYPTIVANMGQVVCGDMPGMKMLLLTWLQRFGRFLLIGRH